MITDLNNFCEREILADACIRHVLGEFSIIKDTLAVQLVVFLNTSTHKNIADTQLNFSKNNAS